MDPGAALTLGVVSLIRTRNFSFFAALRMGVSIFSLNLFDDFFLCIKRHAHGFGAIHWPVFLFTTVWDLKAVGFVAVLGCPYAKDSLSPEIEKVELVLSA